MIFNISFFSPAPSLPELPHCDEGKCDFTLLDAPKGAEKTSRWTKFKREAIYLIPNIMNIVLGAFDVLRTRNRYHSLWDHSLQLDILTKFVLIPLALVEILKPFIASMVQVYFVAAAILVTAMTLVTVYKHWIQPIPDDIMHCDNLEQLAAEGKLPPLVGEIEQKEKIMESLLAESNILLYGKSGCGKTSLTRLLHLLKDELPEELKKKKIFIMKCGDFVGNFSGHGDLLTKISERISGYEDRILFVLDEVDQLTRNPAAYQAIKMHFLDGYPSCPQFIATTTEVKLESFFELDDDHSFRDRVDQIQLQGNVTESILKQMVGHYPTIPITPDAIKKIADLANSEKFKAIAPRRAAKMIVQKAFGKCLWVYNAKYTTDRDVDLEKWKETTAKVQSLFKHRASYDKAAFDRAIYHYVKELAQIDKEAPTVVDASLVEASTEAIHGW